MFLDIQNTRQMAIARTTKKQNFCQEIPSSLPLPLPFQKRNVSVKSYNFYIYKHTYSLLPAQNNSQL